MSLRRQVEQSDNSRSSVNSMRNLNSNTISSNHNSNFLQSQIIKGDEYNDDEDQFDDDDDELLSRFDESIQESTSADEDDARERRRITATNDEGISTNRTFGNSTISSENFFENNFNAKAVNEAYKLKGYVLHLEEKIKKIEELNEQKIIELQNKLSEKDDKIRSLEVKCDEMRFDLKASELQTFAEQSVKRKISPEKFFLNKRSKADVFDEHDKTWNNSVLDTSYSLAPTQHNSRLEEEAEDDNVIELDVGKTIDVCPTVVRVKEKIKPLIDNQTILDEIISDDVKVFFKWYSYGFNPTDSFCCSHFDFNEPIYKNNLSRLTNESDKELLQLHLNVSITIGNKERSIRNFSNTVKLIKIHLLNYIIASIDILDPEKTSSTTSQYSKSIIEFRKIQHLYNGLSFLQAITPDNTNSKIPQINYYNVSVHKPYNEKTHAYITDCECFDYLHKCARLSLEILQKFLLSSKLDVMLNLKLIKKNISKDFTFEKVYLPGNKINKIYILENFNRNHAQNSYKSLDDLSIIYILFTMLALNTPLRTIQESLVRIPADVRYGEKLYEMLKSVLNTVLVVVRLCEFNFEELRTSFDFSIVSRVLLLNLDNKKIHLLYLKFLNELYGTDYLTHLFQICDQNGSIINDMALLFKKFVNLLENDELNNNHLLILRQMIFFLNRNKQNIFLHKSECTCIRKLCKYICELYFKLKDYEKVKISSKLIILIKNFFNHFRHKLSKNIKTIYKLTAINISPQ